MTPEEYIKAHTRSCNCTLIFGGYHEWLTPENALAAVELAREEMMKDVFSCEVDFYAGKLLAYTQEQLDGALERIGAKVGDKVKVIIIKE